MCSPCFAAAWLGLALFDFASACIVEFLGLVGWFCLCFVNFICNKPRAYYTSAHGGFLEYIVNCNDY